MGYLSDLPEGLRLTREDYERMRNSYPLYMFDKDARCRCGEFLEWHREHRFSGHRTGHREGRCPACGTYTQYDLAHASVWPSIRSTYQRGMRLN